MKIIPAILEKDFAEVDRKIQLIKDLSAWIQIDVVDGTYTEGRSFELELLNKLNLENNLLETHLMVKEPENWIEKCLFSGVSRMIGQVEMMANRDSFVEIVHENAAEAGLAFNIETPIDYVPEETEVVLLMGRKAGFGKMAVDERIWKRIEKVKAIQNDGKHRFVTAVDGGVNKENILRFKEAGVDVVNVTGAVFGGLVEENWNELIKTVNG